MPEALQRPEAPGCHVGPPQHLAVGQAAGWRAGSTYRIQPIQERAKRPLWTLNNGAGGLCHVCRNKQERAGEHVMKSLRGVEVEGLLYSVCVISLCTHSFLLCESWGVEGH